MLRQSFMIIVYCRGEMTKFSIFVFNPLKTNVASAKLFRSIYMAKFVIFIIVATFYNERAFWRLVLFFIRPLQVPKYYEIERNSSTRDELFFS